MKRFFSLKITYICFVFGLFLLFFPTKIFAAKHITITPTAESVQTGQLLEANVELETDEAINSIQFDLSFPEELLSIDDIRPNTAIFKMNSPVGVSGYICGIQNGSFNGKGLLAKVVFKGRQSGGAQLGVTVTMAAVTTTAGGAKEITGFAGGNASITVYGEGQKPPTEGQSSGSNNQDNTPSSTTVLPPVPAGVQSNQPTQQPQTTPTIEQPSEIQGSKTEVNGNTGSENEVPLKTGEETASSQNTTPTVKGLVSKDNGIYLGLLPTFLLMLVVAYLGIKLYFTDKRRHLEIESIFDSELSALSALESKIDLMEQKGEDAKERFMAEFEEAKNKLAQEVGATVGQKKA